MKMVWCSKVMLPNLAGNGWQVQDVTLGLGRVLRISEKHFHPFGIHNFRLPTKSRCLCCYFSELNRANFCLQNFRRKEWMLRSFHITA